MNTTLLNLARTGITVCLLSLATAIQAQCVGNLNTTNFGFEDGTLNDFGNFGGSGVALISNTPDVINGNHSVTVQGNDAITKFYFGSITAGNEYQATALTNNLVAGDYAQIQVQWFAANPDGSTAGQIGTNVTGTYVDGGTSNLTATAPAGAAHAQIIIQAGGGRVIAVDDICLVESNSSLFECPDNLIANGNFEGGVAGFYTFGTGPVVASTDAATGSGAASFAASTVVATNFSAGFTEGDIIDFGAALKSSDAVLKIEFRNENTGQSQFFETPAATDASGYTRVSSQQTVPSGTTLIQIFADSNTGQSGLVDDICITNEGPDPNFLPITLTSFTGRADAKANRMEWITATEENTAMFYLERSHNGASSWEEVTTVTAAGSSQSELHYSAEDNRPYGQTYYRLRSVDFDGAEQLSDVILLTRATGASTVLYPNPFRGQLTLDTDLQAAGTYRMMDGVGRLVSQGKVAAGVQTTTINTAQLPAGRYLVRVGETTLSVVK